MNPASEEQPQSVDNASTAVDARPGVFIRTYGCQMNAYDSEKLLKLVEKDYRQVHAAKDAELVLINTCSVRDKPEQKVYSLLGEMHDLKAINPNLMVGVGGCVAQQEGETIIKRSKDVDFVFGTHNLSLVPSLIQRRKEGFAPQVAVNYREEWEELPAGFVQTDKVSVFVSISRGCNKHCSYCVVPNTRGKEVSRSLEEIKREIRLAVHRGAKEVTLLGQTVNSYGADLVPKLSFVQLLQQVSEIPGVERIRFTSPHPQEIREDFVDLVCSNPKICHHVHMPSQSGSDRILKAMNRNYRRKRYLEIIQSLKTRVPDMAITTDVIIGFPGESEEDFQDTMKMLEECRFDGTFSYIFSPRPGTPAELLEDMPEAIKLERLHRYQARQNEITAENLAEWVGKTVEVLVEGPSANDPTLMAGRTSQNLIFNFQATDPRVVRGAIVEAMVVKNARYTLKGTVLPEPHIQRLGDNSLVDRSPAAL